MIKSIKYNNPADCRKKVSQSLISLNESKLNEIKPKIVIVLIVIKEIMAVLGDAFFIYFKIDVALS